MAATMTQSGAHTVERACPHSIEFATDEGGDRDRLPCELVAGHRDPHMARFTGGWGAIGPAQVPVSGLIRWEATT